MKMAYCPECGEQVAEIDIFCPFCGISLRPVGFADETDLAQDNTIAVSNSEIADTLSEIKSTDNLSENAALEAETVNPVVQKEDFSAEKNSTESDVIPSVQPANDFEDAPIPVEFSEPKPGKNVNTVPEFVEEKIISEETSAPEEEMHEKLPEVETPVFLRNEAEKSEIENSMDSNWGSFQDVKDHQIENPDFTEVSDDLKNESEEISPIEEPVEEPQNFQESSLPSITGSQSDYFADSYADTGEVLESDKSLADAAFEDFVPEKVPEIGNETESSMMNYQEAEVKELNEVEEPESLSDEPAQVADEKVEFTQTGEVLYEAEIVESPENKSEPEKIEDKTEYSALNEEIQAEIVDEKENSGSAQFEAEPPKFDDLSLKNDFSMPFDSQAEADQPASLTTVEDEEDQSVEPSIAKPDFEFESEESQPGISKFDSVRIMESSEDPFEETPLESVNPEFPVVSPVQTPVNLPVQSEIEAKPDDSRSYTTPNMGVSNTDGKKSKLKPLDEGTILNNRYEIVRKIGGGGMGAVYLASDKNLGGVLRAVKEMVQSYIEETQQEKAINDFKRESMLLTSLEHPAIPTIFDYFYDEKEARFYLVMKYINGGDLSSRLRSAPEGKVDEKSVVEWAIQIADVLDYLHKRQPPIVYRDLKPANIMIDGNTGKIMLIDFGIARWINKEEKGVTAVGTMGYAPPELFSGNVEARSDIYSLGSTMFHLLTGADPQSNPLLIFDFQKNPRPRQINPQLSDQIERILMRAVEYNAEKRFVSADEMRQELESHLESLKRNQITFGVKAAPAAATLSDQKVFCGFCGQSIVASDLFCAFCGAKQPIAQKGVHGESYASVPITAKLMILGTNELESPSYMIEKDENLVGRRDPMSNIFPEVDLSKFDPQTKISRRHARIWRDGNKFMVEDLGSSNGTVLMPVINDAFRLVPNQPHILTNGDKLKLGDTTLHFVIG